ncbi:DUF2914 domain-containing protein [Methyloglobulus sp.]|uniref:DUF2914 domain-containing protein n=1 Tax=Methyloglobulus sp. TaxID=2518622 RepID=UPI0032B7A973
MPENKNIVIKVKYPAAGKTSGKSLSASGITTEWNLKRIGLALGSVLMVLLSIFYFTDSDDKKSDGSAQLALPKQAPETKSQPDTVINAAENPKVDNSNLVVRAQLTREIKKSEPVDTIALPLKIDKKETLWIHYFIELKGMKGKAVFHEWWLNGELISRKKVNISADPWRTASKQVITYTTNNDWIVRVVDESRNKLAEQSFNLELK